MKIDRFLQAALVGFSLALAPAAPGHAETLRVMAGSPSSSLNVPMNRAVVVESDTPFAELSIANPGIADISTLSRPHHLRARQGAGPHDADAARARTAS